MCSNDKTFSYKGIVPSQNCECKWKASIGNFILVLQFCISLEKMKEQQKTWEMNTTKSLQITQMALISSGPTELKFKNNTC